MRVDIWAIQRADTLLERMAAARASMAGDMFSDPSSPNVSSSIDRFISESSEFMRAASCMSALVRPCGWTQHWHKMQVNCSCDGRNDVLATVLSAKFEHLERWNIWPYVE